MVVPEFGIAIPAAAACDDVDRIDAGLADEHVVDDAGARLDVVEDLFGAG